MERILVVDDEEAMRRLLRINLEDRYEIFDTGNSEEALALAMQQRPSAILLDLRMPNYSGFELCRTFKSMTSTQLIPILIVSGEIGTTTKLFCKELGAAAYFEKPLDFDVLRARLAKLLQVTRPERRKEVRVQLRVLLNLSGVDINDKPFEEVSVTENVGQSSFFCGCRVALKKGSTVDVHLVSEGTKFVGKARVVRSEGGDTPCPRYAFRFVQKEPGWVLQ